MGDRASEQTSVAEMLDAVDPFSGLPGPLLVELEKIGRLQRYENGRTVARAGEPPEFVGVVVHGVLRLRKTLLDGRQHIVGLLMPGDLFGRGLGPPPAFDIEAASDAEVVALRPRSFKTLRDRSPELDEAVALNLLSKLDRARCLMRILASPRVKGRLAGFLLALGTRFAGEEELLDGKPHRATAKIPIGRVDLAQLLGMRTESISRAFHALADDGHILMRASDEIEILDFEALLAELDGEDAPLIREPGPRRSD